MPVVLSTYQAVDGRTVMRYEPRNHARANVSQSDRWFSLRNPVLSTLVALVIAYSSLAAVLPTKIWAHPQSIAATSSNAVNRTYKEDRLIAPGATFAARWNIQNESVGNDLRPVRSERPTKQQMKAKILFGCDPAFGPLVHANFSARCLASADGRANV
jgi:hypothetical protein